MTLEEIKQALKKYESEHAAYWKFMKGQFGSVHWAHNNNPHKNDMNNAKKILDEISPEALRLLLPVVEAAIKIEESAFVSYPMGFPECNGCGANADTLPIVHHEGCPVGNLLEALNPLTAKQE